VPRSTSVSLRASVPLAVAIALAVAFRWPALVHPAETNSDAAIVGLQAMHLLRGEWSWFLWGSGYQTSVDSAFVALSFGVLGPTPRALVVASLGLHLVLLALTGSVLARRTTPTIAALAVFPLVVTTSPLQTYILYPPRQASLTVAVAALWALDRAADARTVRAFATGGALLGLACFADPYALVLVPPIAAFGIACAIDSKGESAGVLSARRPIDRARARESLLRVAGLALGGAAGTLPILLLRSSARATAGQLALGAGAIARNGRLLVESCLPWTIGAQAWMDGGARGYVPWDGTPPLRALVFAGGSFFLLAVAAGGALPFVAPFRRWRSLEWETRRLAIAGGLALPVTIGGFLASPMVMDLFSARYLAAITVLSPFALAPLAQLLPARWFAIAIVPSAAAAAIVGWVGYGPFLRAAPDDPSDEARLEAALAERGVRVARADYWAAYRLTFLTQERLIVVPTNAAEDRYPPYRARFERESLVAYVFDPERSRERVPAPTQAGERAGEAEGVETIRAGRFTATLLKRAGPLATDLAPCLVP
jgi:hypothetical protein